ncbi:MAG: hypothetical protein MHMPM18_004157 [Marteilia pararefringens]
MCKGIDCVPIRNKRPATKNCIKSTRGVSKCRMIYFALGQKLFYHSEPNVARVEWHDDRLAQSAAGHFVKHIRIVKIQQLRQCPTNRSVSSSSSKLTMSDDGPSNNEQLSLAAANCSPSHGQSALRATPTTSADATPTKEASANLNQSLSALIFTSIQMGASCDQKQQLQSHTKPGGEAISIDRQSATKAERETKR